MSRQVWCAAQENLQEICQVLIFVEPKQTMATHQVQTLYNQCKTSLKPYNVTRKAIGQSTVTTKPMKPLRKQTTSWSLLLPNKTSITTVIYGRTAMKPNEVRVHHKANIEFPLWCLLQCYYHCDCFLGVAAFRKPRKAKGPTNHPR